MNYQIIIATERRTDPERMATSITSTVQQGDEFVAGPQQLHSYTAADLVETDFSDPQFVMVASWDGASPYVIQHKGDYSKRNMAYAGWPDLTKEQYDALPVDPVSA